MSVRHTPPPLDGSGCAEYLTQSFYVELGPAIVGIDAVDFLLDIRQLGIGKPGDVWMVCPADSGVDVRHISTERKDKRFIPALSISVIPYVFLLRQAWQRRFPLSDV